MTQASYFYFPGSDEIREGVLDFPIIMSCISSSPVRWSSLSILFSRSHCLAALSRFNETCVFCLSCKMLYDNTYTLWETLLWDTGEAQGHGKTRRRRGGRSGIRDGECLVYLTYYGNIKKGFMFCLDGSINQLLLLKPKLDRLPRPPDTDYPSSAEWWTLI